MYPVSFYDYATKICKLLCKIQQLVFIFCRATFCEIIVNTGENKNSKIEKNESEFVFIQFVRFLYKKS